MSEQPDPQIWLPDPLERPEGYIAAAKRSLPTPAQWAELIDRLAAAQALGKFDPQEAVGTALVAVLDFMRAHPSAAIIGLHTPLEGLAAALHDHWNGGTPSLLRREGRPRNQCATKLHGILAAFAEHLRCRLLYLPNAKRGAPAEAAELVARAANRIGISRALGGRIAAKQVAQWRYKLGVRITKLDKPRANHLEKAGYTGVLAALAGRSPASFSSKAEAERFLSENLAALKLDALLF